MRGVQAVECASDVPEEVAVETQPPASVFFLFIPHPLSSVSACSVVSGTGLRVGHLVGLLDRGTF